MPNVMLCWHLTNGDFEAPLEYTSPLLAMEFLAKRYDVYWKFITKSELHGYPGGERWPKNVDYFQILACAEPSTDVRWFDIIEGKEPMPDKR